MRAGSVLRFMLAGGLLFTISASALAETADGSKEMALRKIMKDLGANMQTLTHAISMEDWQQVERTAPLIADHPQPPMTEKLRIMAFMGTDMGKFKGHDTKVHEAADLLGQAAKAKDGTAVIAAFSSVQTACYSCHRDFRGQFLQHFYGTRP
jgi:cytochrome c556